MDAKYVEKAGKNTADFFRFAFCLPGFCAFFFCTDNDIYIIFYLCIGNDKILPLLTSFVNYAKVSLPFLSANITVPTQR